MASWNIIITSSPPSPPILDVIPLKNKILQNLLIKFSQYFRNFKTQNSFTSNEKKCHQKIDKNSQKKFTSTKKFHWNKTLRTRLVNYFTYSWSNSNVIRYFIVDFVIIVIILNKNNPLRNISARFLSFLFFPCPSNAIYRKLSPLKLNLQVKKKKKDT